MRGRRSEFLNPRGWLRRLTRTLVITAAITTAVGAGTAGWAAQAPAPRAPHLAQAGPGLPGKAIRPANASGLQCFYVYPTCTSSDPSVQIPITNSGDTSACTFQFTVVWGDTKSTVLTFPGGADGTTLATFTHAYDSKPDSYQLNVSGVVIDNSDPTNVTCSTHGGDYQFNLTPEIGLAALRFAKASDRALTTAGLPVIKDDGSATKVDRLWGPAHCDGVTDPTSYDYLGCQSPVPDLNGPSAKDWPVIYTANAPLTINEVVFVSNGPVSDPQLTANVSIRGATGPATYPVLNSTPMTIKKVGGTYQLTATKLTFNGDNLPAVPGRDALSISWTITDGKSQVSIAAGDEHFTLYVTAGQYAPLPPGQAADEVGKPYETLLDVGTVAAAGQSGEQAVYDAIWQDFASRKVAHPIMNPVTGAVTYGPAFDYYSDDYPKIADWFNRPINNCPSFATFLATSGGHCGNFAEFLAGVLAFQGISADVIGLGDGKGGFSPGFYPGPDPAKGHGPAAYAYMLVGPGLWTFGKKNALGNYPYRDNVTVRPSGKITISGSGVSYRSAKPIAQGPITDPPMMFYTGDHAIVQVSLSGAAPGFVDPSYGNPQGTTMYPSMPAYEKTAIAGFAVIYKKVGSLLFPLQSSDDVAAACKPKAGQHIACYFQAVPHK